MYNGNLNANNAPRTLADALNQYEVERAKHKFGFEKDRKKIKEEGNSNKLKPQSISEVKQSTAVPQDSSKVHQQNMNQNQQVTAIPKHVNNQQLNQISTSSTPSNSSAIISASTSHIQSTTTPNGGGGNNNSGGISRFQQPPSSVQLNKTIAASAHQNVYLQNQNQPTNSAMTVTAVPTPLPQYHTHTSAFLNASNKACVNNYSINQSNTVPLSEMQMNNPNLLDRPSTSRGHPIHNQGNNIMSSAINIETKENLNVYGKRMLDTSSNLQQGQHVVKKSTTFTGTSNPYSSKRI